MKGYRDAFHPPPPSPPPIHHTGSDQGDHDHDQSPTPQAQGYHQRTSSPPPLFEEPDIDIEFDDGIDMDEMAAMEEMEREEASRSRLRPEHGDDAPPVLGEEDDWEGLYD